MKKLFFNRDGGAKDAQPLADKGIYTLNDMSEMFHVTVRTIYNWMELNRFSYIKVGSKTYITEKQLQEFLANHEVKSFNVGRIL